MVMTDEMRVIRDKIIHAIPIEKLYLFGSYANGTPNENSDYDLYIVIPDGGIRPVEAIGEAHLAMRGTKAGPVDILAGTSEIFERRSKQFTIERKIANEGIVLYERGQ